jgi:hypothetical protein
MVVKIYRNVENENILFFNNKILFRLHNHLKFTGIRVFKASMISSSNAYNNSLYNIENQGVYDIQAIENL